MKRMITNNLGETLLSRPIYNLKQNILHIERVDVRELEFILKDVIEADILLRTIDIEEKKNEQ